MERVKIEVGGGRKEDYLKVNPRKKLVNAGLRTLVFDSDKFKIVYFPSLNLSAYGETDSEASDMATVVLRDYFDMLLDLSPGELSRELKQYGWERKPFMPKQLLNIQTHDVEAIKQTFDLPKETRVRQQFALA